MEDHFKRQTSGGEAEQAVFPSDDANVPLLQLPQKVWPCRPENEPSRHKEHTAFDVAPEAVLNLPAAHLSQAL